jgi:NAD(P)-dependent dehydrogenase (short-subunit alcohol dehydrogenase family)
VRALLASGGGAIVCTASPAGLYGIARGLDAYSASKAGLYGLVRVMAVDYAARGVRVNGVFPGVTETPMNHWWMDDPQTREEVLAAIRTYEGAIVLVTHDEGAVHALEPDRVLILPDGVEDLWNDSYADLVALA